MLNEHYHTKMLMSQTDRTTVRGCLPYQPDTFLPLEATTWLMSVYLWPSVPFKQSRVRHNPRELEPKKFVEWRTWIYKCPASFYIGVVYLRRLLRVHHSRRHWHSRCTCTPIDPGLWLTSVSVSARFPGAVQVVEDLTFENEYDRSDSSQSKRLGCVPPQNSRRVVVLEKLGLSNEA